MKPCKRTFINKIYFYFGSKTFESNGLHFPKIPAHKLLVHTLRHNPHLMMIIAFLMLLFTPTVFEMIEDCGASKEIEKHFRH